VGMFLQGIDGAGGGFEMHYNADAAFTCKSLGFRVLGFRV
jgi:hypothetical protein